LKRPRYQRGNLTPVVRKGGLKVWVYRWREIGSQGEPVPRKQVIGTVEEHRTQTAAWRAVESLRFDLNHETRRAEAVAAKFSQLLQHYRKVELNLSIDSCRGLGSSVRTALYHQSIGQDEQPPSGSISGLTHSKSHDRPAEELAGLMVPFCRCRVIRRDFQTSVPGSEKFSWRIIRTQTDLHVMINSPFRTNRDGACHIANTLTDDSR